jgi:glycosyltransferase involved in cell wall biosynthesis
VDELRRSALPCDIVVVDDASSDETPVILDRIGVRRLRMRQRLGVGGAVRAGLRYARRLGHDVVVRVDGDGQHAASDIPRLLEPIRAGRADVTRGARVRDGGHGEARRARRAGLGLLARCLSIVAAQPVTDPTSGFWAFGPRAVRFLAAHHPSGYPEPELHLLLSRNGLRVEEVPVGARDRLAGRTSLTPFRTGHLLARTLLAIVVVPLRSTVEVPPHD